MPVARKLWQPIRVATPAFGAAADHAGGVGAGHASPVSRAGRGRRAERNSGALAIGGDAGGVDVGVEIVLEQMMRRHLVLLAAFLVQAEPPAPPSG